MSQDWIPNENLALQSRNIRTKKWGIEKTIKSESLAGTETKEFSETQSGLSGFSVRIPSNSWGDPILLGSSKTQVASGFGLASRLK